MAYFSSLSLINMCSCVCSCFMTSIIQRGDVGEGGVKRFEKVEMGIFLVRWDTLFQIHIRENFPFTLRIAFALWSLTFFFILLALLIYKEQAGDTCGSCFRRIPYGKISR